MRSSGNDDIAFSALSGDTVVLRLLPLYSISSSGSGGTAGLFTQDMLVDFAITAVPVPEPQPALLMLVGLGVVACKRRRRPAADGG